MVTQGARVGEGAVLAEGTILNPAIPVIDAIMNSDSKVSFGQRHTAHQIWELLQIEIPGCDVGESTVRTHVRVRKAELNGAWQASSQIALAWMMKLLHTHASLLVIKNEFPSGTAPSLLGIIKGGRLRERKKALAVLGGLKGIHVAVVARCLQMSRRTVRSETSSRLASC